MPPSHTPPSQEGTSRSLQAALNVLRVCSTGNDFGSTWQHVPDFGLSDLQRFDSEAITLCGHVVRRDYDPDRRVLTLRMPEGRLHKEMVHGVSRAIEERLQSCLDSNVRYFQEQEEQGLATRFQSFQECVRYITGEYVQLPHQASKQPDFSFKYRGHRLPSLVGEIAYSEKSEDLPDLAQDYIGSTQCGIRTVITVDIDYRIKRERTREQHTRQVLPTETPESSSSSFLPQSLLVAPAASLCLYRKGERISYDESFCDDEGRKVDGDLELQVADFIPSSVPLDADLRSMLESTTFVVPFKDIYDALILAHEEQNLMEEASTLSSVSRAPNARKMQFQWDDPRPRAQS